MRILNEYNILDNLLDPETALKAAKAKISEIELISNNQQLEVYFISVPIVLK